MNPKVNMRSFHGICPNESIFHQPIGFPEIRAFPLLFTTISGDHSAVNRRYKLPLEKSMGKYACPSSHFLYCFFFNWKIIQGKLVGGFNQIEKYYIVKLGSSSPNFGMNIPKKYLKPPPSYDSVQMIINN